VEQLRNEVGLSTIGTSYQGNGRVINLVTSIQVIVSEVSHSQNSSTPTPFHLAHLCHYQAYLQVRIRGTKPLVDYSKSHVVTTIEYLEIMQMKFTQKEVLKHIIEAKRKEKEE